MEDVATLRFTSSVVDYPDRGPWGESKYRGNCTGHIIRQFLASYHPRRDALFVDPMEGSQTARDVARSLGVRYAGLDLRYGFDLVEQDLLTCLEQPASTIWLHPPYAGMIPYSGNVWGEQSDRRDLSAVSTNLERFTNMLKAALANVYRALEPGGHYGALIGAWRHHGRYHDLPFLLRSAALGELVDIIVKTQRNTRSSRQSYNGKFIPILHEQLFIFRKNRNEKPLGPTLHAP